MNEIKLIVMLTHHDQTVLNAVELFESCKDLPVMDWGFKNIGLPIPDMKELVALMKKEQKTTYLEVVTYSEQECLDAAKLAIECQFDYLMGTIYYPSVHKLLKEADIKYMPFCGKVWGNPSLLGNTIEDVIDSAKRLEDAGVFGTDILAYRFVGEPEALLNRFMKVITTNVVVAGSIDSYAKMDYMKDLKPYGITMGSALFDKKFVPGGSFRDNLNVVKNYIMEG